MNSVKDFHTFSEQAAHDRSLQHLLAEFTRLDVLLRRQIDRWQAANQDPSDAFRGLYVSDREVDQLLQRPVRGSWGHFADFDESQYDATLRNIELDIQAIENKAGPIELRLQRIVRLFKLNPFEKDVLLLALATEIDLRYQRIYGYLQDDVTRKLPTVNLALDLFSEGLDQVELLARFNPDSPLNRWHLLVRSNTSDSLLNRQLQLAPTVTAWLLGYDRMKDVSPPEEEEPENTGSDLQIPPYDPELILSLTGPDTLAQEKALRELSHRTLKHLLTLNLAGLEDDVEKKTLLQTRLRDACLLGAIPVIKNWDTILDFDAPPEWLFTDILEFPDLVVILSSQIWRPRGIARKRRIYRMDFPVPTFRDRLSLWNDLLKKHPEKTSLDLTHLAGQFALTTGQIRDAFEAAQDAAAQRLENIEAADLLAAARSHSNPRLGALAKKIEPRFDWNDIILPHEQITILHEITSTVRQQPKVLDDWGVGNKLASSRGVTVLFAGPPGTGKTMAAEIMADDLGLDLYKIDLSGVVSKYIGETEKNLEKVFEEAASSNAILFFDEADALFGKRSEVRDAHDRYANLEISYLLQRMEAYDGVTILATNLRANLDDAFTRRLQFAIDFPFPEEEDRLRIWKALLPAELPLSQDIDFELLAQRFRIAGGNIRNVIVNAAYLAAADGGRVTMEHLLHGTRRELQKMGRLLNESDLLHNGLK